MAKYRCGCQVKLIGSRQGFRYAPTCETHGDRFDYKTSGLRRTRIRKPKAEHPEHIIQTILNIRLLNEGIHYLRIPDLLYRLMSPLDNRLNLYEKKMLSGAFAGLPDNDLKYPMASNYYLGLLVECKSDVGKLRGRQKVLDKKLGIAVVRTQADIDRELGDFQRVGWLINQVFRYLLGHIEEAELVPYLRKAMMEHRQGPKQIEIQP